jgi:hypothetical protein
MAPLIMVTLLTVSSFFPTCGCFLRVERSFSRMIFLLSLTCGWPLSANGSLSCVWRHLHELRVEGSSGARKGGRTDPWSGPGRFDRPFATVGSHVFMHFAPSICTILTMLSSRPRWRFSLHEIRSFTLQSSGMFLCNSSVLATIGSNFIKVINTNKTP